jgi:ankyrin repeat protein
VHFAVGEFPDEWVKWAEDNLTRGIKPLDIIDVIVRKGFHPAQNPYLMHKLCASAELDKFVEKNPDFDIHDLSRAALDLRFLNWVKFVGDMGIDGNVFLEVLTERDIQVTTHQIHLAQKIKNNEYTSLIDFNGGRPKFMDFWTACEDGLVTEVQLYLAAEAKVNLEMVSRSGESLTPLMLAAKGNHHEVLQLLIDYKADVLAADRRGRTALHHGALHGATEACGVLMDAGSMVFGRDNIGNTPLHLAAMKNRLDTMDLLAAKGQEFTRSICADKLECLPGVSFNALAARIFQQLQDTKLRNVETRRFQKDWLHEGSALFRNSMAENRKHMIAPTSEELMRDVLLRFDPRPETGIRISHGVDGGTLFIPTIPSPVELAVLLKYMYRQSALDNCNNMLRTPLHVACDENVVESHKAGILMLINKFGVNVLLKDYHGMTPFDLLVVDKQHSAKAPTSTAQREHLLYEIREEKVLGMIAKHEAEDRKGLEGRRQDVLDICIRSAHDMPEHLWDAARGASELLAIYGEENIENTWHLYEDPETKNRFFVRAPVNPGDGDVFNSWSWTIPDLIRSDYILNLGWLYQRLSRSEAVTTFDSVMKLKCKKSGAYFYFFIEDNEYQFEIPDEFTWYCVAKDAKFVEKYGFSMEWQEFEKNGTHFYFNKITQEYRWKRPMDAITVTPSERFCTTYGVGNRRIDQKWYTCEQCNNLAREKAMELDPENTKQVIMKFCEPCIYRCHKGHKGTRLVRKAPVTCVCNSPLSAGICSCRAQEVSHTQIMLHQAEQEDLIEENRIRQRNALMPFLFCPVPKYDKEGTKKRESGWMICRQFLLPNLKYDKLKSKIEAHLHVMAERKKNVDWRELSPEAESDAKSRLHLIDLTDESCSQNEQDFTLVGSMKPGVKDVKYFKSFIEAAEMHYDLFIEDSFREAYRRGWRKVYDPEEPEVIEKGARVLCVRDGVTPKCYGSVLEHISKGVYLIKFTKKGDTEKLSRDKIEVISKNVFYYNIHMKVSVWTLPPFFDENNEPITHLIEDFPEAENIEMSGEEWHALRLVGEERRLFANYDEVQDPLSKLIYYVNNDIYNLEVATIHLQNWFRQRRRLPRVRYWTSTAFTFNKPDEVFKEEKTKGGWALLRRRSKCVGDFQDVHFQDWEELMDEESADFFYWQEDTDVYSFDKPEVSKVVEKVQVEPLEIDELVNYVFPGKEKSETGVIVKLRTDDQTHETMYDIQHRMQHDIKVKWVPRYMIRKVAKSPEELKLALSASAWKKQIRRQRDKDYRKRQMIRKRKQAEELAKRQQLAEAGGSEMKASSSHTIGGSSLAELERGRIIRSRAEKRHREDLRNAKMLEKQRAGIDQMLQDLDMGKVRMSKSEQISMQRAFAIKLDIENKMERRNAAQTKLLDRRNLVAFRMKEIDTELRKKEELVTTPRSLIRRRLLRDVHFAMIRQSKQLVICDWGCGDWVRLGQEQQDHQLNFCSQRIVQCALHCNLKMSESEWLSIPPIVRDIEAEEEETFSMGAHHGSKVMELKEQILTRQEIHETGECPKRMIACPNQCLEWVSAESLEHHMKEMCVKRDAKPIECRLGCGKMFGGIVESMIEAEDDRINHEDDECEFRRVQCSWKNQDGSYCAAQICATERNAHRDMHLEALGISTYCVPGMYKYKVPPKVFSLKLQLWGGGGGSGHFYKRRGGSGGGGSYVEVFIYVQPHETLDLIVAQGGQAGVHGTEIEVIQTSRESAEVSETKNTLSVIAEQNGNDDGSVKKTEKVSQVESEFQLVEQNYGVALGGEPGGGQGSGGGGNWAAGGGGGYSIVSKRLANGSQVYAVTGGGGGGGSQQGVPGCGLDGAIPGALIDVRNGGCGLSNLERGGAPGDSGSIHNSAWTATQGEMWQGGNGSQFGGGGGGGYFGGGGGGTSPGIGGKYTWYSLYTYL